MWEQEGHGPPSTQKDRLCCSHCNLSRQSLDCYFKATLHLKVCSHCNIPRHTKDKCQGQVDHGLSFTQEQYEQFLALLNMSQGSATTIATNQVQTNVSPMSSIVLCNSTHTTSAWILDTRAIDHMIYSPSIFTQCHHCLSHNQASQQNHHYHNPRRQYSPIRTFQSSKHALCTSFFFQIYFRQIFDIPLKLLSNFFSRIYVMLKTFFLRR